jgi:hypothetical protein
MKKYDEDKRQKSKDKSLRELRSIKSDKMKNHLPGGARGGFDFKQRIIH